MDTSTAEARAAISLCFVVGAIGTMVGLASTVVAARSDDAGGLTLVFAWLVLAAGSVLLAIAVIAWGVSLGVRASGQVEATYSAARQASSTAARRSTPDDIDPLDPI